LLCVIVLQIKSYEIIHAYYLWLVPGVNRDYSEWQKVLLFFVILLKLCVNKAEIA